MKLYLISVYIVKSTRSQTEIIFKAIHMIIPKITTLLCPVSFWNLLCRPSRQLNKQNYFPCKHEVLSSTPRTHVIVAEMEIIYGLGNTYFHYWWLLSLLTTETNTEPLIQHHSPVIRQQPGGMLVTFDPFICGRDITLSLLKYILILSSLFACLYHPISHTQEWYHPQWAAPSHINH